MERELIAKNDGKDYRIYGVELAPLYESAAVLPSVLEFIILIIVIDGGLFVMDFIFCV